MSDFSRVTATILNEDLVSLKWVAGQAEVSVSLLLQYLIAEYRPEVEEALEAGLKISRKSILESKYE